MVLHTRKARSRVSDPLSMYQILREFHARYLALQLFANALRAASDSSSPPTLDLASTFRLALLPSLIPEAGLGLFVVGIATSESEIGRYGGELLKTVDAHRRYSSSGGFGPYCLNATKGLIIDGQVYRTFAGFMNTKTLDNEARFRRLVGALQLIPPTTPSSFGRPLSLHSTSTSSSASDAEASSMSSSEGGQSTPSLRHIPFHSTARISSSTSSSSIKKPSHNLSQAALAPDDQGEPLSSDPGKVVFLSHRPAHLQFHVDFRVPRDVQHGLAARVRKDVRVQNSEVFACYTRDGKYDVTAAPLTSRVATPTVEQSRDIVAAFRGGVADIAALRTLCVRTARIQV